MQYDLKKYLTWENLFKIKNNFKYQRFLLIRNNKNLSYVWNVGRAKQGRKKIVCHFSFIFLYCNTTWEETKCSSLIPHKTINMINQDMCLSRCDSLRPLFNNSSFREFILFILFFFLFLISQDFIIEMMWCCISNSCLMISMIRLYDCLIIVNGITSI